MDALLAGVCVRQSCDVRLLDGHEQLAIGDRSAWIGDCMRREPLKRDAYESIAGTAPETAALAHRSFDRVWAFAGAGKSEKMAPQPAAASVAAPVSRFRSPPWPRVKRRLSCRRGTDNSKIPVRRGRVFRDPPFSFWPVQRARGAGRCAFSTETGGKWRKLGISWQLPPPYGRSRVLGFT